MKPYEYCHFISAVQSIASRTQTSTFQQQAPQKLQLFHSQYSGNDSNEKHLGNQLLIISSSLVGKSLSQSTMASPNLDQQSFLDFDFSDNDSIPQSLYFIDDSDSEDFQNLQNQQLEQEYPNYAQNNVSISSSFSDSYTNRGSYDDNLLYLQNLYANQTNDSQAIRNQSELGEQLQKLVIRSNQVNASVIIQRIRGARNLKNLNRSHRNNFSFSSSSQFYQPKEYIDKSNLLEKIQYEMKLRRSNQNPNPFLDSFFQDQLAFETITDFLNEENQHQYFSFAEGKHRNIPEFNLNSNNDIYQMVPVILYSQNYENIDRSLVNEVFGYYMINHSQEKRMNRFKQFLNSIKQPLKFLNQEYKRQKQEQKRQKQKQKREKQEQNRFKFEEYHEQEEQANMVEKQSLTKEAQNETKQRQSNIKQYQKLIQQLLNPNSSSVNSYQSVKDFIALGQYYEQIAYQMNKSAQCFIIAMQIAKLQYWYCDDEEKSELIEFSQQNISKIKQKLDYWEIRKFDKNFNSEKQFASQCRVIHSQFVANNIMIENRKFYIQTLTKISEEAYDQQMLQDTVENTHNPPVQQPSMENQMLA